MITEDHVSFETAKLLKEKGFDKAVLITDWWCDAEGQMHKRGNYSYSGAPFYDKETCFNCPTLQMAMKWLRDEKHYYIQVMLDGWACGGHLGYYVVIQKTDSDFEMMLHDAVDEVFYQTYEEACEAAIKYCLENLI